MSGQMGLLRHFDNYRQDNYKFSPANSSATYSRRDIQRRSEGGGGTNSSFDIATDSGYGSLGSSHRKNHMRDTIRTTLQESSTSTCNLQDDDNQTVYSDAQSLYRAKLEIYISEFAEEIAAVLPRSISVEQLPSLSTALPDLLKAFAIKFGCEDDTRSQYRLMYLVHKYRKSVNRSPYL